MPERLRVGVVGAGAVARCVHLPILARRSDRFAIAAICDPFVDAAKLAADRFGVAEVFANTNEMLASSRLDAVLVLHSGTHAPTVLAALGAGLGVFSEKPLAYTRAEVAAIAAAANDRPVMVGYMKAYDPAVVRARQQVNVAAVRSVEVLVRHPPPAAQLAHSELEPSGLLAGMPPPPPSDADLLIAALGPAAGPLGRTYADIVLGSLSHDFAVMRAVGLSIDRVDWARRWGSPTIDGHFSVAVAGWTPEGASVSLRWHYLPEYPAYREEVRFHHDDGSVELVFPTPYLLRAPTELRVNRATDAGEAVTVERSPVEAFEEELLAFHDLLVHGRAPYDGVDSALADVVTAQRITVALAAAEGIEVGGEAAQRS